MACPLSDAEGQIESYCATVALTRGLHRGLPVPTRPVIAIHCNDRWQGHDTYIFDAA